MGTMGPAYASLCSHTAHQLKICAPRIRHACRNESVQRMDAELVNLGILGTVPYTLVQAIDFWRRIGFNR